MYSKAPGEQKQKIYYFNLVESEMGEKNGNPLQYSCLENPVDRGAWWAAICGVAQSQTQLRDLAAAAENEVTKTLLFDTGARDI